MNKFQIARNVKFSIFDVLTSSILLFILYRYIIETIGVKKLGIWSLILATTSITKIGEFGLGGSVVKYVAKYIALNKRKTASNVIQTALITISVVFGIIIFLSYWIIDWGIKFLVPISELVTARQLVPYAIVSLWLTIVTGVIQSGLDGCQRIDVRKIIMLGGNFFYFSLIIILIKKHGLLGLAYSQLIHQSAILLISLLSLWKIFPEFPVIPSRWKKELFLEIVRYGLSMQLITILAMFIDPLTKILLSKFGELASVGYFEMANKLVLKIRSLLINANQVMVPVYASLHEDDPNNISIVYKSNMKLILFLSIPGYFFVIAMAPAISNIWIGSNEAFFVNCIILLSIGWFVNTINAPAYFAFMGVGTLRWNLIGQIITGSLCLLLGLLFGFMWDENGIILARSLSSMIGGWVVIIFFNKLWGLGKSSLWSKEDGFLFVVCLGASSISIWSYSLYSSSALSSTWSILSYSLLLYCVLFKHSIGNKILGYILHKK